MVRHIEIDNALFEAICRANLSGGQYAVLLAILRKTNGWHKEADAITRGELSRMTGIESQGYISQLTSELAARNIICVSPKRGRVTAYAVNPNADEWVGVSSQQNLTSTNQQKLTTVVSKTLLPPSAKPDYHQSVKADPSKDTLKDTCTKDTNKTEDDVVDPVVAVLNFWDSKSMRPAGLQPGDRDKIREVVRLASLARTTAHIQYFIDTKQIRSLRYMLTVWETQLPPPLPGDSAPVPTPKKPEVVYTEEELAAALITANEKWERQKARIAREKAEAQA